MTKALGQPQRTDWLRRRVYELMAKVGVRRVRPFDVRHACLTYLGGAGVPDVALAAWAGHRRATRMRSARWFRVRLDSGMVHG